LLGPITQARESVVVGQPIRDRPPKQPQSKGNPLKKRDMQKIRKTLEGQRDEILVNARKTLSGEIHLDPDDFPDEIDSASSEMNLAFQGRLRERERGLLSKIIEAIDRIDEGIFGECSSCGEDVGLKRMQARPMATLCIDCKAEQEQQERRNA
jgi:DnaK suppressor protein